MNTIEHHVGEQLSGYIDGELTQQDRQRVERHCEQCDTCREQLNELRDLRERMGRARLSPIGEDHGEDSAVQSLPSVLVGTNGSDNEDNITHMSIDGNTLVQLDVLLNSVDNKPPGSLAHLIDSTKSPGGSRMLVSLRQSCNFGWYLRLAFLTNVVLVQQLESLALAAIVSKG